MLNPAIIYRPAVAQQLPGYREVRQDWERLALNPIG